MSTSNAIHVYKIIVKSHGNFKANQDKLSVSLRRHNNINCNDK